LHPCRDIVQRHEADPHDHQGQDHTGPAPVAAVGATGAHINLPSIQPAQNIAQPTAATRTQQEPVEMVLAGTLSVMAIA